MNELISRQAALYEIDKNRNALLQSGMKDAEHILVHYGRRAIEELPPIEPKRGKWKDGNKRQICSECLYRGYRSWHYCPNCGAKMERSEE